MDNLYVIDFETTPSKFFEFLPPLPEEGEF
jgi:hypothetical protein